MTRMVWFDPPDGSRYGFPKLVYLSTVENETLLRLWLAENNYPAGELDLAVKYHRYWNKINEV
jgi:hypothetical protein